MTEMTSRERFARMYAHREADRVPVIDSPWEATIERWQSEGMPKDVDYSDFFGLDRMGAIGVDNSPRYALGAAGAKRVHHAFSKSRRDEAIIDTERRK